MKREHRVPLSEGALVVLDAFRPLRCSARAIENKPEAAYRRGDLLEKRRQPMKAWATFRSTRSGTGGVVALHAGNEVFVPEKHRKGSWRRLGAWNSTQS